MPVADGMSCSALRHLGLNTNKREIRLLKATPQVGYDSESSLIHCETYIFDLACAPNYTAVSYCWGSKAPVHTILLNGRSFSIRENLYNFLLRWVAGSNRRDQYLWVDQLCIDQSNVEERSHQVQSMGDIYASAQRTILWLGLDDGSDFIDDLDLRIRLPKEATVLIGQLDTHDGDNVNIELYKDDRWWRWLLSRTYWTRLWVVQEICLSTNNILWFGRHSISWFSFSITLQSLIESSTPQVHDLEFFAWLIQRQNMQQDDVRIGYNFNWRKHNGDMLIEAMKKTQKQDCANALDTIFALGSLVQVGQRVAVDYSVSAERLFKSTILQVMQSMHTTSELLDLCGILFVRLRLHCRRNGFTLFCTDGFTGFLLQNREHDEFTISLTRGAKELVKVEEARQYYKAPNKSIFDWAPGSLPLGYLRIPPPGKPIAKSALSQTIAVALAKLVRRPSKGSDESRPSTPASMLSSSGRLKS